MSNTSKENILVLEDEFIISENLRQQLIEFGYKKVYTAFNGQEAIDIVQQYEINFAILDISIPGSIDGIATAQEIIKLKKLPILFISAYTEKSIVKRALEVIPYNYLVKPWKDRELYVALEVAKAKFETEMQIDRQLKQLKRDLLAQKDIELEQLNNRNKELESLLSFRNNLLSILSHDISSPISSISGIVQMLLYNKPKDSKDFEFLEAIDKHATKSLTLLSQLLKWSSSKINIFTYKAIELDLVAEAKNYVRIMQGEVRAKQIELEIVAKDSPIYVLADKNMLITIFLNLISNAINASSEKGKVVVTLSKSAEKAVVCITDEGVGISEEQQKGLLELPDDNEHIATVLRESNGGLGLKIAISFVRRHKEKIWVESAPGKGSSFYFTLKQSHQ